MYVYEVTTEEICLTQVFNLPPHTLKNEVTRTTFYKTIQAIQQQKIIITKMAAICYLRSSYQFFVFLFFENLQDIIISRLLNSHI